MQLEKTQVAAGLAGEKMRCCSPRRGAADVDLAHGAVAGVVVRK